MFVVITSLAECKAFDDFGFDNREQALQHCNEQALQHPHTALGVRDTIEYARNIAYHGEMIHPGEKEGDSV